ncbi:MAG: sulfatase-like hydrolase/transferase [Gemmatimonadota bacterium]
MNLTNPLKSLRSWLLDRAESYATVVVVLALNVPLFLVALARHVEEISWLGFSGLYAVLVFLGWHVFLLLVLITGLFFLTAFSQRLFVGASAGLLTLTLFYLIVNGVTYRALRQHLDAFWMGYFFSTFGEGLGLSPGLIAGGFVLLGAIAAAEWSLVRVSRRLGRPKLAVVGVPVTLFLAFVASQVIHIVAYEANDTRITSLTPQLPFYYPTTSHDEAVKYGGLLPMIGEDEAFASGALPTSLSYPLADITCKVPDDHGRPNVLLLLLESWRADALNPDVTPRMHELAERSSVFLNHFSSGNSTPQGVFPLFYGLHSTYWPAVKANAPTIDNPVLIDALEDNGYAFGIFAESHFDRHKIKDAIFRGIPVREPFEGETPDEKDEDMTNRLFAFMEEQHRTERPFFGFAFYKSTHYSYHYPEDSAPFQPTRNLNIVLAAADADDPTPVLHDYLNSVHWVDQLVGRLVDRMEKAGILENTILVVTSDHGEEFNDNGRNYWGHTGNFTRYQTQVPMIVYSPWEKPRRVTSVTSHVDLPPTLLQEGLDCGFDAESYSNGRNLFEPLPDIRPVVSSSYVNHALIMGQDVFVVFPMYVDRYRLDNVDAPAGSMDPELMRKALEQMGRFYGTRNGALPRPS